MNDSKVGSDIEILIKFKSNYTYVQDVVNAEVTTPQQLFSNNQNLQHMYDAFKINNSEGDLDTTTETRNVCPHAVPFHDKKPIEQIYRQNKDLDSRFKSFNTTLYYDANLVNYGDVRDVANPRLVEYYNDKIKIQIMFILL